MRSLITYIIPRIGHKRPIGAERFIVKTNWKHRIIDLTKLLRPSEMLEVRVMEAVTCHSRAVSGIVRRNIPYSRAVES